ncbi:MAG: hypothetical protein RR528_04665 [Angelakisella sp.]
MLCPTELAILVNTIAIAIGQGKSQEELNILATIFMQIGDTLTTMSVQSANIQQCCCKKEDNSQ